MRSYKKQLVKKNWGRILDLAWLKFAVAALYHMTMCSRYSHLIFSFENFRDFVIENQFIKQI